ncbi:MAG: hypothetical protein IPJ60_01600 [Sphingobacteriaceae bacterium]|nr:hypothetical protein [Sphingobacteriaceae bacterium]
MLFAFSGIGSLFYVGYQFSFSDTFALQDQIKEKEEKLAWLKEKEKELPLLKAKMEEFEKAYSKNDSLAVRDKLTAYISEFAEQNECLVTEIPNNSSFSNDDLNVQTNTFTIKGDFNNLLTLLNTLETKHKYIAKIMSARFYTVSDMQAKKKSLFLTIITQSFEQKTS